MSNEEKGDMRLAVIVLLVAFFMGFFVRGAWAEGEMGIKGTYFRKGYYNGQEVNAERLDYTLNGSKVYKIKGDFYGSGQPHEHLIVEDENREFSDVPPYSMCSEEAKKFWDWYESVGGVVQR